MYVCKRRVGSNRKEQPVNVDCTVKVYSPPLLLFIGVSLTYNKDARF
jgi:hypothetical protein